MIIDAQEHARSYAFGPGWLALWQDLAPLLAQGSNLPEGTYSCHGFATRVWSYTETENPEAALWKYENHNHHIDLQILLEGKEDIWLDINRQNHSLPPVGAYDAEKDVQFFAPHSRPVVRFTFEPGLFCLFFPHDVHAPALTATALPALFGEKPCPCPPCTGIKKLVVKIPLAS